MGILHTKLRMQSHAALARCQRRKQDFAVFRIELAYSYRGQSPPLRRGVEWDADQ
jgi:hypothetical protein